MQSRKGIQGPTTDWIWGAVDFCNTYPNCDSASTYIVGNIHYYENEMYFQVINLPTDLNGIALASDETLSYRILARRQGEGQWHLLNWVSAYEGSTIGTSDGMTISVGDTIVLKPTVGYIEQYNEWILERDIIKGGVAPAYGTGDILLDMQVTYNEISQASSSGN